MQTTSDVPKPKKRIRVSDSIRNAAKAYKAAYKHLYGMKPRLSYDGVWIRIGGGEGISLRRLKELTSQLKRRAG